MKKRRLAGRGGEKDTGLEGPAAAVANLFDLSVVFLVGVLFIVLSTFGLMELMNPDTQMMIMKKDKAGATKILIKKGNQIRALEATDKELKGEGVRLGTAYMLTDGTVVYVPDESGGNKPAK